jgi:hypothetical protein
MYAEGGGRVVNEILFRDFPKVTEENYESLSQGSWCLGRDSNSTSANTNLERYR